MQETYDMLVARECFKQIHIVNGCVVIIVLDYIYGIYEFLAKYYNATTSKS